jgi:hypothetical protein
MLNSRLRTAVRAGAMRRLKGQNSIHSVVRIPINEEIHSVHDSVNQYIGIYCQYPVLVLIVIANDQSISVLEFIILRVALGIRLLAMYM